MQAGCRNFAASLPDIWAQTTLKSGPVFQAETGKQVTGELCKITINHLASLNLLNSYSFFAILR